MVDDYLEKLKDRGKYDCGSLHMHIWQSRKEIDMKRVIMKTQKFPPLEMTPKVLVFL